MRFSVIFLAAIAMGDIVSAQQNATSSEYMFASSPLKSGGRVVSRTSPGQGVQTYIDMNVQPANGAVSPGNSSSTSPEPIPADASDATTPQPTPTPVVGQPATDAVPLVTNPYPYPVDPLIPYQPGAPSVAGRRFSLFDGSCLQKLRDRIQNRQRLFGSGKLLTRPPQQFTPRLTNPADVPPAISFGGTTPQPDMNWQPGSLVSNTAIPGVNVRNAVPGTQTGVGLLGRPRTYQDGQPFRNLLRFFVPEHFCSLLK
ncbi:MAG: hypothetical protein R3C03_00470 [Pirellulaceae bacterium]